MRIVVATAEPRGAYHLSPLAGALAASGVTFTHLTPYPEEVQGDPVIPVTADASVIAAADRVVITGGTLSAWTELVVRCAASFGKEIVFSELAYVADASPASSDLVVDRVTALSPDGAAALRLYLGVDAVDVTGTPALDGLPAWSPVDRRVLVLSTSDMVLRDPDLALHTCAITLRSKGWDVRVRPHPREDLQPWDGFEIVSGETQAESASSAAVVVGYPGSAHVLAAAVGVPTIALAPTPTLASVFSSAQSTAMSANTSCVEGTLSAVAEASPPCADAVAAVVGPIGGAAERLVSSWVSPLNR